MKPIHLASIVFILLVGFLVWEIIFSTQHYGLPKLNFASKPTPGKCKVLEEKYCASGKTFQHDNVLYMAFNLPPTTPLFAPKDGLLDKTKDTAPYTGFIAVVRDSSGGTIYRGNIQSDNLVSKNVKAGDIIGYIGSGEINDFGYKLLITITKKSFSGPTVDENNLKALFK